MVDPFISYRRKPSASLALLIQEKLKNDYKIDCYVDTTRTDSTQVQFPDRLMKAIADAPVFICLLGDSTLESEWVLKEIRKAHELGKFCIPVFQESYKAPQNPEDAVTYLLNFDGVHVFDQKNIYLDEAVSQIAGLIPRKKSSFPMIGLVSFVVLAIVIGVIVFSSNFLDPNVEGNNADETQGSQTADSEISTTITESTDEQTEPSNPNTDTPEPQVTATPTQGDTADIPVVTEDVLPPAIQLAIDGVTSNAEWEQIVGDSGYVQEFDGVEMVLVPSGCFMMGSETNETDEQPVYRRCNEPFWIDQYEVSNSQFAEFLNVMGNQNPDGGVYLDTSQGIAQVYANGTDWQSFSNFEDHPVIEVTWFGARDYCEFQGGRLPTESEWEYASRGPDDLIYPWGNEFDALSANFCDENCELSWAENSLDDGFSRTAPVNSYPDGISWVGAYNLSGNVKEWVSTLYSTYQPDESNEDLLNREDNRVLRGGSWDTVIDFLRSSRRVSMHPTRTDYYWGFRCARDFNPDELEN